MKLKNLLLATSFLLVAVFTNAQEIRFALKTGLNMGSYNWQLSSYDDITDTYSTTDYNYSPNAGFYLGARVEYGLNQRMSIQGEIFYQNSSATANLSKNGYYADFDLVYNDLSIPLVFKFYLIPQKLSINLGASLGILLAAYEDYYYYNDFDNETESGSVDLKYESYDDANSATLDALNFGVSTGVEYRVSDNIFVDGRYNIGLTDLANYDGGGNSIITVSAIQIGAGWRF